MAILGTRLPIVQAPIGSAVSPELVAAVGEAGALGMLAATWHSPEGLAADIAAVRKLTAAPFGVNLVLDFPIDALLEVALQAEVPVISTFWGEAGQVHERIAAAGATHVHVVGSTEEARHAEGCGVDILVAQGLEAGGHVRGTVGTMSLVPAVVDAVDVPVLAAGGITDRRGMAAALALGASGVWVGTRFVGTRESRAHVVYRRAIVAADAEDAVWTTRFDGGWPDAPHRALRNSSLAADLARDVVAHRADGGPIRRYDDTVPLTGMTGELEALAMYAGQGVGTIRSVQTVAAVVSELAAGMPQSAPTRSNR
ncbi:nitronate monooxygenase [Kribbella capetownensis]|uniref:Nitronate monooxygenase n=1 Tax=Kribbella capetownensis TaxID=1572659 RepID=A0A4V2M7V3_9ACTN|nr:nitronate monooxygenase [Kribbella capetownensis]TCC49122.1 nitronate monooxygenase [Kribbella capetownensis]